MTNETRRARQERKRAEAEDRQAAYNRLSHAQKLERALQRVGKSSREYKRLVARGG
jgi:hypothetical protein